MVQNRTGGGQAMDNPRTQPAPSRQPASGRHQELWEPTIHDVLLAQRRSAPHLTPTPLLKPAALARALGCEAYVKCENLQPVGAFKVRGGVNLVAARRDHRARQGGVRPLYRAVWHDRAAAPRGRVPLAA